MTRGFQARATIAELQTPREGDLPIGRCQCVGHGAAIRNEAKLTIKALEDSELVLVDEVPRTALGKVVRSALASGHAPSSD